MSRRGQHRHAASLFELVSCIADLLEQLLEAITHPAGTPAATDGHTRISVTAVDIPPAKECSMEADHSPPLSLPSTTVRAKLSVVGPKRADGTYLAPGDVHWFSSDTTQLPLSPADDDIVKDPATGDPILDADGNQIPVYSTYANTPLTPEEVEALPDRIAKGTVTVGAADMNNADILVSYTTPALGHFAITAAPASE